METNLLFILLQSVTDTTALQENLIVSESYFSLLIKGGWVLLPIFLLLFISVFVIIKRWLVIRDAGKKDNMWLSRIAELIKERKIDKASVLCSGVSSASSKVIQAGLDEIGSEIEDIQDTMQVEAGQQISRLELQMNYLGITSSIAPMLGFLGTIFGVIKIFYNISVTNDLSIANISDGLYQKMICSGVGLFVGIIAYAGYYILNGKIDRVVSQMDKDSNEILKSIRQYKKKDIES